MFKDSVFIFVLIKLSPFPFDWFFNKEYPSSSDNTFATASGMELTLFFPKPTDLLPPIPPNWEIISVTAFSDAPGTLSQPLTNLPKPSDNAETSVPAFPTLINTSKGLPLESLFIVIKAFPWGVFTQ